MFHTIRASQVRGRHWHSAIDPVTLHESDRKAYFKGVVFTTAASLILICGTVMTALGFSEVFGGSVAMVGMLMCAIAVLLYLFAIRQFLLARKIRQTARRMQITHGTVAAMVIEREDGAELGTVTVVMDTVNLRNLHRNSHDDQPPPNYTEATSDYFADSTVSGVASELATEHAPPPYGPPKYEDVVSSDVSCPGEKLEDITSDDVEHSETVMPADTGEGTEVHEADVQSVTAQPPDREPSRITFQSATRSLSTVQTSGYQDLPTVTI